MTMSTLSFSTSLRTLLSPSDGSAASSSRKISMGRPSISAPSCLWPNISPASVLSPRAVITLESGSMMPTRMGVAAPTSRTKAGTAAVAARVAVVFRKRRLFMEVSSFSAHAEVARLDVAFLADRVGLAMELDTAVVEHVAPVGHQLPPSDRPCAREKGSHRCADRGWRTGRDDPLGTSAGGAQNRMLPRRRERPWPPLPLSLPRRLARTPCEGPPRRRGTLHAAPGDR